MVESRFASARFRGAERAKPSSGPVDQLAEQQTLNLRVVGSIPTRLTSFNLTPPGSDRDSVNAVLAQARPALCPHCYSPRFSIRRRLFSGPATDESEAARPHPPVCPAAVRLSKTPRPKSVFRRSPRQVG